jgi:hypothetical protein
MSNTTSVKIPLVVRDPVHDLIRIECPFAVRLINTEPMQRLRRIKHLGLANMVYPGAEHTRFNHTLGVYHLALRAMASIDMNLESIKREKKFDKKKRLLVGLCALLHDIGHGPFSHLFERLAKDILKEKALRHEKWIIKIIKEHPEMKEIIRDANKSYRGNLIEDIAQVFDQIFTPDYVVDLITSQMDVDRFDYLIRDSRNTGCHYGEFDLNWIFRSLRIEEIGMESPSEKPTEKIETGEFTKFNKEVIAVDYSKGKNCVEEYLLGRHFMYIHLYYHKTIVSAELMLGAILKRAVKLISSKKLSPDSYPVLKCLAMGQNPDVMEYLSLDDHVVLSWVGNWALNKTCDSVLHDLSRRLIHRNLFVKIEAPEDRAKFRDAHKELSKMLEEKKFAPLYYLLESDRRDVAHKDYIYHLMKGEPKKFRDIHFVDTEHENRVCTLSDLKGKSVVVEGSKSLTYQDICWYVPKEIRNDAESLVVKFR